MTSLKQTILLSLQDELKLIFSLIKPDTTDIVINPNGYTFIYKNSGEIQKVYTEINANKLEKIALMLAFLNDKSLNYFTPSLSATIPELNYRFEILIPPIVDAISMSIRIPHLFLSTLDSLQKSGMVNKNELCLLQQLIIQRKNILISGETGCGKTTLLNALVNFIPQNERLVIIEEETKEINTSHNNIVNIVVDKTNFTGQNAVASSLRMNPDRIIYGETRDGKSCLEMLKAWRTGHKGGLATIHANNAKNVKNRICDLLTEVSFSDMKNLVDNTIDTVIQLGFVEGKRKIIEILNFES